MVIDDRSALVPRHQDQQPFPCWVRHRTDAPLRPRSTRHGVRSASSCRAARRAWPPCDRPTWWRDDRSGAPPPAWDSRHRVTASPRRPQHRHRPSGRPTARGPTGLGPRCPDRP